MTTYKASLDYWSQRPQRPLKSTAFVEVETDLDEDEIGEFTVVETRRESRNRYLRFLLLNLLVWPILVFVGLQVSQAHTPKALAVSGARSLSADQLVTAVQSHGRPVFWLNRLSGDTYSENSSVNGVDTVSYLPEGTNVQSPKQLDLVIKTYRDSNVFNVQLHPLQGTADTTVESAGGITVVYNPAAPDHSVVTFKDRPQVVAITYPSFQSLSTLMMDAQNLALIK